MAETTIEWADYTFNPWVGCTKVSPACAHCYAENWAKRTGNPQLWQGARRRTTIEYWQQPFRWNDKAKADGVRQRVFCASLADVFDNVIDPQWRSDLFQLIERTPQLDWLLLTKRIGNTQQMLNEAMASVDGYPGNWDDAPWPNVWIGATVANQEEADRDIPKLLRTPARVRFLSIEPMLGPIDLVKAGALWADMNDNPQQTPYGRRGIDWVIAGGESGGGARPSHPDWFRDLRDQCGAVRVPFLFKQWGNFRAALKHEKPTVWVNRFDRNPMRGCIVIDQQGMIRVSKESAGRDLDGRTWDQFPEVA